MVCICNVSKDRFMVAKHRKASLFRNNKSQAVRLPKDFEFEGVSEVTIEKQGNSVVITPARESWLSFGDEQRADSDFLSERPDLMDAERVQL